MWARKRWTSRVFAAILLLSVLPTFIIPNNRAAGGAQFGSYEGWIRAQLRIPVDGAVEEAMSSAIESGADSFDEFLAAFLEAYAEAAPGQAISQVFTERNLSDDALISFLQRRYSQVGDEGVLHRVALTSLVQQVAVDGKFGLAAITSHSGMSALAAAGPVIASLAERTVVISLRTLSSARPLGP